MPPEKVKEIALAYGVFALAYAALALMPLFFVDFHDVSGLLEYVNSLTPAVAALLLFIGVNVALAAAAWRIPRLGRVGRTVLALVACGVAVLTAAGAARGLWYWHLGRLPDYAELMPFLAAGAACGYAVQAVGVLRAVMRFSQ